MESGYKRPSCTRRNELQSNFHILVFHSIAKMLASLTLLSLLAVSAPCRAAPAIEQRSTPAAFSTFTHNPVYYPLEEAPLWRTAYARAIQVQDGSLLLTWEDYPYGESSTNLDTFKILRSVDGGASWSNYSQVADTQNGWGMRFRGLNSILI
jgi:hypothetical protein